MQRNCSEPKYVFQSFDSLYGCYKDFGGIANSNPFAQVVNTCLNDYCNNTFPELGGCAKWTQPTDLNFTISYHSSLFLGYTSFNNEAACEGVKGEVNSDLAGPGVFTSYMMQLVILLYLWFFLRLSREGPSLASYFSEKRKLFLHKALASKERRPALAKMTRLFDRHHAVLKHTLVEFQEAQCFFMLASQIAVLWSTSHSAALESHTLRSLIQNTSVSGMVSSTGILPVVIGMWSLQRMHKCSPWNFVLSVVTVIVSEVALYQTRDVPSIDKIVPMDYNGWPASCGFSAPPLIYCGLSTTEFYTQVLTRGGPMFFLQWSNPYCLVLFGMVILLWIKTFIIDAIGRETFPRFFLERAWLSQPPPDSKWGRWLPRASGLVTFLVEIAFIGAMVMDITAFDGFDYIHLIDWGAWSFGQVVAITLWFPVASKYIYWLVFGTEAYSKARIPSPYRIIKQQVDKNGGDYGKVMSSTRDGHVPMS
ncbi:hypothetical protein ED733_008109 [Metarhizium rileyi]|uniref:Uncharacterized protein n=1 Tax=Metarhizium rileyi (strain RCEF 4871) TaxID=1649241 RepID=A0A5C6GNI8_METRR|nr:hypothetical protein ED733_008109 [Metarhizium rileyi]